MDINYTKGLTSNMAAITLPLQYSENNNLILENSLKKIDSIKYLRISFKNIIFFKLFIITLKIFNKDDYLIDGLCSNHHS